MCLWGCYAISGISLAACYLPMTCYAMSGTEIASRQPHEVDSAGPAWQGHRGQSTPDPRP
eukprot:3251236-Rhodomonas_salina.1